MLGMLSNLATTIRQSEPVSMLSAAIDRSYSRALREDGMLDRTQVSTPRGWIHVESIDAGDEVLTFDGGTQRVVRVLRSTITRKGMPQSKAFVMHVPARVLGNDSDLRLMPNQEVIIESDEAEATHGDPFVLVPAMMLEGYRGIKRVEFTQDLSLHMLMFDQEQIVHVSGGALLSCRSQADFSPLGAAAGGRQAKTNSRLPVDELERLIATLRDDASNPGTVG